MVALLALTGCFSRSGRTAFPACPAAPRWVGPLGPHARRVCGGRGGAERRRLDQVRLNSAILCRCSRVAHVTPRNERSADPCAHLERIEMSSAPSGFDWLTFAVAAVGAVTGIFAAAWNVVQYISSGAKIYVTASYIYDIANGPVLEVNAYNKRRGPIEVRRWGVRTYQPKPSRIRTYGFQHATTVYLSSGLKRSDEVSKTIQGGHGATWAVQFKELNGFDGNKENWVKFRAIVLLGNGDKKKSRPLRIPPGSLHQVPRLVE